MALVVDEAILEIWRVIWARRGNMEEVSGLRVVVPTSRPMTSSTTLPTHPPPLLSSSPPSIPLPSPSSSPKISTTAATTSHRKLRPATISEKHDPHAKLPEPHFLSPQQRTRPFQDLSSKSNHIRARDIFLCGYLHESGQCAAHTCILRTEYYTLHTAETRSIYVRYYNCK